VRLADVAARLEALPAELPEGPPDLIPVLAADGTARPRFQTGPGDPRTAAVLVLLYPDEDGEAHVLLTERVDRGGHHSGEVSFPGGRTEPGDRDLVETALREAREEVGLDPRATGLRVIATLPPLTIPVSNYAVTPVLAVARRRPELTAAPAEVARILHVPVNAFLPSAPRDQVEREIRGWRVRYAAYPIEGLSVWGMTARVLGILGALLADSARATRQVPDLSKTPRSRRGHSR